MEDWKDEWFLANTCPKDPNAVVHKLSDILDNAKSMSTKEYMEYCDTIQHIEDDKNLSFGTLVRINGKHACYHIHWMGDTDGQHVIAYMEPGAYVETMDIFAINRRLKQCWGFVLELYASADHEPLVTLDVANNIRKEIKTILA